MKRVFKETLKGTIKYILGILICSLISSFLMVYLTKFISFVIDGVIMQTSDLPNYITICFYSSTMYSKLIVLAIFMLIFVAIIGISNYIKSMFNAKFKVVMNTNLKKQLLNHITYLEYNEYKQYGKNQILQRVSSDANNFVTFIEEKYNLFVESIFILIFSMLEILNINIVVSLSIMLIIAIISIMSVVYFKLTRPIVQKNIDLHENLIQRTMSAIYYPKMIKIFNREQKEIVDFNKISDEYRKNDKKLIDYLIYYELIGSGIRKFKDPIIFLVGGLLIINGKMNIGSLMILMTYSSNLLEYVLQIIYAVEGINEFLIPANRISHFLKLKNEKKKKKKSEISNISIKFINVTLEMNSIKILNNVSFEIKEGEQVYLVGDNGSGKSLLIKILLGFIPYKGQILLGGIDIAELDKEIIRDKIGVVFQDSFIFSDTIKNNIDIFSKYKDIKRIQEITEICELNEEIEKFSNGYNEMLGERGINLSGGQKQRIAIARMLLQNKSIIILDDALSKVDNKTKKKMLDNFREYTDGKIVINITQDLIRIPEDAKVLFIDNKKVICDSQANLIAKNKNYNKLISICSNVLGEIDE